jgi:hypothetical protein
MSADGVLSDKKEKSASAPFGHDIPLEHLAKATAAYHRQTALENRPEPATPCPDDQHY